MMKKNSSWRFGLVLGPALAMGTIGAAQAEVINFEGFEAGAVLDVVVGDEGSGPIGVEGINPALAGNTAIVFDSNCPGACSGNDVDLGTPNMDFGGPGEGPGGIAGATFPNDTAQNNILIVAEDLEDSNPADGIIDDPDDANVNGASLSFDFSALGTVTIESITLIDVEQVENAASVSFFDALDNPIGAPIGLPQTGNNGLADDVPLGPTAGVVRMVVAINGSGAIDDIVFTPEERGGEGCTPGYWKQRHHFDSWSTYHPTDQFSDVFEDAFPGMTLHQVLRQGGGGLKALGRHTVAGLLNAASPDTSYDMSVAEVIAAFNDVYPGAKRDYNRLKNQIEGFNESGCPLN